MGFPRQAAFLRAENLRLPLHHFGVLPVVQPDIQPHPLVGHGVDHLPAEHQPVEDQRAQRFQPRLHTGFEIVAVGRVDEQMRVHIAPAVGDAFAEAARQPRGVDAGIGRGGGGEGLDVAGLHHLSSRDR